MDTLIAPVGAEFRVSGAILGLVPGLNQLGLALGLLFLLPLGDRINNRRLIIWFTAGQLLSLLGMAFSSSFTLFLIASCTMGFCTIAPYLLPAYVSQRVRPERIGYTTGIMASGVVTGILVSRALAGFMGEYWGWRSVYILAAIVMIILFFLVPRVMEKPHEETVVRNPDPLPYGRLLMSLWPIMRDTRHIIPAALIQAMGFGAFISLWLGLGLHLTSPEMGYGVDVVGYLALLTVINVFTAPRAGQWADRAGPIKTRILFCALSFLAALLLPVAGYDLWLLIPTLLLNNLGGASADVCNRTLLFSLSTEHRTRIMTIYLVIMFIGGGMSSWVATAVWDDFGWPGIAALTILLTGGKTAVAIWEYLRSQKAGAAAS